MTATRPDPEPVALIPAAEPVTVLAETVRSAPAASTSMPASPAPLTAPEAKTETLPEPLLRTMTPSLPAVTEPTSMATPVPLASLDTEIPSPPSAMISALAEIRTEPPPVLLTLNTVPVARIGLPPGAWVKTTPELPVCVMVKASPPTSTEVSEFSATDRVAVPAPVMVCSPPTIFVPLQVKAPSPLVSQLLLKYRSRSNVLSVPTDPSLNFSR